MCKTHVHGEGILIRLLCLVPQNAFCLQGKTLQWEIPFEESVNLLGSCFPEWLNQKWPWLSTASKAITHRSQRKLPPPRKKFSWCNNKWSTSLLGRVEITWFLLLNHSYHRKSLYWGYNVPHVAPSTDQSPAISAACDMTHHSRLENLHSLAFSPPTHHSLLVLLGPQGGHLSGNRNSNSA